ncbi:MAG TPA: hypothetical protein EYP55_02760 [Anaerolineae bacterium]|nr:hypothetical protein [Anaerolineae bacterium]
MSTRVAELTLDELKQLIEATVEWKLSEMLGDPDEGLELREEIKTRLQWVTDVEGGLLTAEELKNGWRPVSGKARITARLSSSKSIWQ